MHRALQLVDRKTLEYRQIPALQWDVELEDVAQIDEDGTISGLVGVPLDDITLHVEHASEDEDFDFDAMVVEEEYEQQSTSFLLVSIFCFLC